MLGYSQVLPALQLASSNWQPHAQWHVPCRLLQESLADLNRQLAEPLPMNRFRPNVVVSTGGPGWVDDTWAGLRTGE
jgi:uncharacterized protein YcbX